jgi:electron transfer flavoprotein alpha subunit
VELVKKYKPEIFFLGASTRGRDLAGAVATYIYTGLTADCTGLEIEEGTIFCCRSVQPLVEI